MCLEESIERYHAPEATQERTEFVTCLGTQDMLRELTDVGVEIVLGDFEVGTTSHQLGWGIIVRHEREMILTERCRHSLDAILFQKCCRHEWAHSDGRTHSHRGEHMNV
jgi:hypothetical protein